MKPELFALMVRCLAMVESGGDASKVGRAGERGKWQMTPAVVVAQSGYAQRHAESELHRLENALVHMDVDPNPFNVVLAWNAGLERVRTGTAPVRSYQHAQRVCQLMQAEKGSQ